MGWTFGDSWDFYSTTTGTTDELQGYWDGGSMSVGNNCLMSTGRFSSSQALGTGNSAVAYVFKNSGSNDAVHHINVAFIHTVALSGTSLGIYIQLLDGSTGQCAIVFRSDGAIVLTSSTAGGSTLATYTGAFGTNVWTAFEFEVVINNSTGSFTARKNGNTSADFTATGLNTRGGTSNNYASRLQLGNQSNSSPLNANNAHKFDDILWRSDPSSVSWVGDVRAAQMMPLTDASAQFSKSTGSVYGQTPYTTSSSGAINTSQARYGGFIASYDGTLGSAIINLVTGYTGNMKCSLFSASVNNLTSGVPATVIASATTITNPASGNNTFTFSSPPSLTKSTVYFLGFSSDTSSGTWNFGGASTNNGLFSSSVSYASFPAASPGVTTSQNPPIFTANITLTGNYTLVNESQENTTTDYVYDGTVGHADLYTVSTIPTTSTVTAVTTRGYMAKSDVGLRAAQVQLKSSSTTVQSTALNLSTSFQWAYRTDTVDPATNNPWLASNLNSAQIGPIVTS